MATINKITEIIATIKTIYSYYAKDTDPKTLVKLWNTLLRDFPDEVVDIAFYKALQTCKMPPTPAEVIENIKALQNSCEPTDEELWAEYTKALRNAERQLHYIKYPQYPNTPQQERAKMTEIWNSLSDRLKEYIGSEGEMVRMARDYDADDLKFEKNRFLKNMPIIKERQEFKKSFVLLQSPADAVRIEGGQKEE